MRPSLCNTVYLSLLLMAGCVIGCESDHHAPPPRDAVVVEPGYYYDAEYYDEDHHFHPRQFYYYDGHEYRPHDAPPPEAKLMRRPVDEAHGHAGEFRDAGQGAPGEALHSDQIQQNDRGGQLGPRDR